MEGSNRLGAGLVLAAAVAAAGCDGTPRSEPLGSNDPCVGSFLMGTVTKSSACTACGDADESHAIDGVRLSHGTVYQTGGSFSWRARAPSGVTFPAGNFAGALMRIPASYSPGTAWTINTYSGNTLLESRTPGNASGGDPSNPSGQDDYYGFTASMAFDGVEVIANGGTSDTLNAAANPIRIYEFCGQR